MAGRLLDRRVLLDRRMTSGVSVRGYLRSLNPFALVEPEGATDSLSGSPSATGTPIPGALDLPSAVVRDLAAAGFMEASA